MAAAAWFGWVVDVVGDDTRVVTVYKTDKSGEVLETRMKVEYDSETDTLTVTLRAGTIAESDEDKPGVILDYDEAGNLLSIEVLDACPAGRGAWDGRPSR